MSSGSYRFSPPPLTAAEIRRIKIEKIDSDLSKISTIYDDTVRQINILKNSFKASQSACQSNAYKEEIALGRKGFELNSTKVEDAISKELLIFTEIDIHTNRRHIAAIDFSGIATWENAKNSQEYKKNRFASEITKKVLQLSACDSKAQESIDIFINIFNRMLSDDNVSYDYFRLYVQECYNNLEKECEIPQNIDEDTWQTYCALCSLLGKRPKMASTAETKRRISVLIEEAYLKNYYKHAKEELEEVLDELGLKISDCFELDGVTGNIITEKDNSGYRLFVSHNNKSFVLETISPENQADATKENLDYICHKRKKIPALMRQRGIDIEVRTENDYENVAVANVITEKNNHNSISEKMRKKHTIDKQKGKVILGGM